ncbi:hypothetical protein WA026_022064 [Henosepilachna vigintioctopunctata]|uniref:Uncharacterized protein n=1 Tax=Henosepilachna vigintioctopunctata TaxID=420089 RepID=A0AAW1UCT2_9CUCU
MINTGSATSSVSEPISNQDGSPQFVINAETTTPDISDHEVDDTNVISYTKNTASPLLPLCVTDTSNKNTSNAFVSPEVIRPYPKAGPRKNVRTERKKGRTRILTDTPEKLAIENELEARKRKKEKKITKVKAKVMKGNLYPQAQDESTSEEEELPPSPLDISVSSKTDSSSESENEENTNASVTSGDWVQGRSRSGYDIKFAKKINDIFFKWPAIDDISIIAEYQVIKKLPTPKVKSSSRRVISFEFPKSLKKFKIN